MGEIGALAGRRWELSERTTRIGRDPALAIVIQDTSVSRFHAQITRQASGYYLADLESSNGTQVNGELVSEPRQIVAGDLLCLGEVVLRCEEVSPDPDCAHAPAGSDGAHSRQRRGLGAARCLYHPRRSSGACHGLAAHYVRWPEAPEPRSIPVCREAAPWRGCPVLGWLAHPARWAESATASGACLRFFWSLLPTHGRPAEVTIGADALYWLVMSASRRR